MTLFKADPSLLATRPCLPRTPLCRTRHVLHRSQAQSQAGVGAPPATREALRAKLLGSVRTTGTVGNTPQEALDVAKQLEHLAAEDPVKVTDSLVAGRFKGLLNNFPNVDDGGTSLGNLTFGQFGPKELSVGLQGIELLQSFDTPGQYVTRTFFTVREGPHSGLVGIQSALGEYDLDSDKPARQNIYFTGIRIEPKDASSEGLQRWRAALESSNPGMAEDGTCEFSFPKKLPGFRDFILLDHEVQATLGNRGSLVVVKRAED